MLLTSVLILYFLGEVVNLTTHTRIMETNNGFSTSFFFIIFLVFLWIGAQFPQEKFLSYARILTLHLYSYFYILEEQYLLVFWPPRSLCINTFSWVQPNAKKNTSLLAQ